MPSSVLDNPLVLPVLGLLVESPMHPYLIERTIRERGSRWPLNRGSLNNVVTALARVGWIQELTAEREGNRPVRTVYRLTAEGGAELKKRVDEHVRDATPDVSLFLGAVSYLGTLTRVQAIDALSARERALQTRVEGDRLALNDAIESGLTRLMMIEVEGAIHAAEAECRWVRSLIADIESGSLTWSTTGKG